MMPFLYIKLDLGLISTYILLFLRIIHGVTCLTHLYFINELTEYKELGVIILSICLFIVLYSIIRRDIKKLGVLANIISVISLLYLLMIHSINLGVFDKIFQIFNIEEIFQIYNIKKYFWTGYFFIYNAYAQRKLEKKFENFHAKIQEMMIKDLIDRKVNKSKFRPMVLRHLKENHDNIERILKNMQIEHVSIYAEHIYNKILLQYIEQQANLEREFRQQAEELKMQSYVDFVINSLVNLVRGRHELYLSNLFISWDSRIGFFAGWTHVYMTIKSFFR
jgi:hypothetical protein